ncbi:MAG TPA: cytochrome b [Devosia sp.]|nr:cytochrome b [Devosia sp.]
MTAATVPTTYERYDSTTIVLHWLTALLVAILFGTAWLWNNAPREWHLRSLEGVHVSLGIAFTAVLAARLAWRALAGRRLPAVAMPLGGWLSRLVHWALYALLAAQVALGFALRWLQGEDFGFFGLFQIPSPFAPDRAVAHQIEDLHNLFAWTLVVLAGGHALVALIHRYVLRDGVLRRMLPSMG